jgi:hypothetical protein
LSTFLFARKPLIVLKEVSKPIKLIVEKDNIFVVENYKISIYNKKTLTFKKSFGKKGEGPKEFPRPIQFFVFKKNIVICSFNKILWFTKEGNYLREVKKSPLIFQLIPISEGYLYNKMQFSKQNKEITGIIGIYDKKMQSKKILSIEKTKLSSNRNRKEISVFNYKKFSITDEKNIIIADTRKKKSIKVFNHKGKFINSIALVYPKVFITKNYKEQYIEYGINNTYNDIYRQVLKTFKYKFPKYLLPFCSIFSEKKVIYVFRDIIDFYKYEVWAMSKHGEIKKKIMIDKARCYWIDKGVYYYILENEDDEEWVLYSQQIIKL